MCLILLLLAAPCYAYIDPGTGSALVYVVTAVIVSLYFAARGLCERSRELVLRPWLGRQKCDLALHSEDPRYEETFLPVLRALVDRGVEVTYLTMYERDASFAPLPRGVYQRSIPAGLVGYSYLNHLEARLLVTTTPQLDVMTFRRAKRVRHYGHLPHALGESRFVRPFAYDYFDAVFCCGPLLERNIRTIESRRGLPAKRLLQTGVPHYDGLLERARGSRSDVSGESMVLIAPSWGPLSLFHVLGTGFVRRVAERFDVIVRPHPQMRISQPALYAEVEAIPGVRIDRAPTPAEAMARAAILVSDISGIIYEFAFIHEKPVVVIEQPGGAEGFEGHLLENAITLRERCREFIVGLPPTDVEELVDAIGSTLARHDPALIAETRGALVYNWGAAGPAAARQIEETLAWL